MFYKYREDFERYIKEQNAPNQEKTVNECLFTSKEIETFFTYDENERVYYFNEIGDWPDFESIRLDEKSWNVDISKVNEEEYHNVHFSYLKQIIKLIIQITMDLSKANIILLNTKKTLKRQLTCYMKKKIPKKVYLLLLPQKILIF